MFFSKLKISTKLIISSAVFLIPIGVMLFFILSTTLSIIQKSIHEREGISTLKPAIIVMQKLPEYLNVSLGLENGDLRRLDETISSSLRIFDREIRRYRTEDREPPALLTEWETLKKISTNDEELYQSYLNFAHTLRDLMIWIGERSGLMLPSSMSTYYFISPAFSSIPEASIRFISVGNVLRRNLYNAEKEVQRWNTELAEAQAQGRRMNTRPFTDNPKNITPFMITLADSQVIMNSRPLFESDQERISASIRSAMEENSRRKVREDAFEELGKQLERYEGTLNALSSQYGRMFTFNATTPVTIAEILGTISETSGDIGDLWTAVFNQLDTQIEGSFQSARNLVIIYLLIVLISLIFAIGFVVFITLDINRSVKTLKSLFRGLNENDLTLSLHTKSKDEFGELMVAFNGFLNILRSTFGSFKQSAQLVSNSVFDLSSSSKEITTTANEQSASVSEIVSTMESNKNLSAQISLKTTEVAHLAKETQELSSKGAELRESNQIMMEDIRKQNQKIISEIRNLSDMIIRISEAIRIIDGIADQTKLIAFNASLEASSSGEAGARFSVVASEIRRFADNVVESTKEIKQKIEEVQGASQTLITEANSGSKQIEIGYERMSEQKIVFEHIVDNSQNVATRSQQISNLSKQQELASSQIFTALKEISAGVKQFVIATSSTSKIADSLNGMSVDLKEKVEKYRTEN